MAWRVKFVLFKISSRTLRAAVWPEGEIISSILDHLQSKTKNFPKFSWAKADSKLCQITNKPFKIFPRTLINCQSGKISPNLVTLLCGGLNNAIFKENETRKNKHFLLTKLESLISTLYRLLWECSKRCHLTEKAQ